MKIINISVDKNNNVRIFVSMILASILLFSLATSAPIQATEHDQILMSATMQINLVMVGDTWAEEDEEAIKEKLFKSYAPTIFFEDKYAGVNYSYNYVFVNMTAEKSNELFQYMNTVAVENTMPSFIAQWMTREHSEFGSPDRQTYKMVSAFAVEEWLSKLEREDGYTIYFLNPPRENVNYLRTYGAVGKDPDTGNEFIQEGMLGFGGKYRFYFIDLTAGPWLYPYVPTSDGRVIGQFHKNLYDVKTKDEFHNFIAGYVNDAILLLFTPSYLYSPVYKLHHKIDVFLIDMTSGRVFHDVSGRFIDKSTIENAFAKLVPYAQWSSNIQGHSFDSLPRELQRAILRSLTFKSVPGSGDIILVRSADLINELNEWVASNLTSEQLKLAAEEAERTVFIPVVLFVFDKEAYVDREAVLGAAIPDPMDNTVPCCAVVAVDRHALFNIGTGLSVITIHEMGHVLGLRHPHDGYSPTRGEFANWFFDWSYTPMTYATPSGLGCGIGHTCGLVITEFGQFNYDAIDRGLVLYLLRQAYNNIRDSIALIEEKGYGRNTPSSISSKLNSIERDVENAREHFVNMTYFNHKTFTGINSIMDSMDDAFSFALRALITSEELLEASANLSVRTGVMGVNTIGISQTLLVNESGTQLDTLEVGKSIGIKSQISNNVNETVVFTYIVQIKDGDGNTVFLRWVDGLSIDSEDTEQSLFWTPEVFGEFHVEIFVWKNLEDPLPLSPVKNVTINVG